jgi:hypothetical protein
MTLGEQIIQATDAIENFMTNQDDLKNDVLPFMQGTFFKLRQLAHHDGDEVASYELYKIASVHIPQSIHSYCALPIEYRNTRIISGNKTPRDLLIDSLKTIQKEVTTLEQAMFSNLEQAVRVNHNLIQEKYKPTYELHQDLQNSHDTDFVNQFDINTYLTNPDVAKNLFLKNAPELQAQKMQQEKREKQIQAVKNACSNTVSFVKKTGKSVGCVLADILESDITLNVFGAIIGITIIGGIIWGIISGFNYMTRYDNYVSDGYTQIKTIYSVMQSAPMNTEQISVLEKNSSASFLTNHYRQNLATLTQQGNKIVLTMKEVGKNDCQNIIDNKPDNFNQAQVNVNNVTLPLHDMYSSKYYTFDANHQLCYLDDKNLLQIVFDSKDIYAHQQNEINHDSQTVQADLKDLNRNIAQLQTYITQSNRDSSYEKNILNDLQEKQKTLSNVAH